MLLLLFPHLFCHEVMGPDAVIFIFWMLSFKSAFSLSSFILIQRLFSSCLLSAIRVMSSVHQTLLIFLLAILIPSWASSSPAFCTMYSACKLSKQGNNIQSWCTPFLILGMCPIIWPKEGRISRKKLTSTVLYFYNIYRIISL